MPPSCPDDTIEPLVPEVPMICELAPTLRSLGKRDVVGHGHDRGCAPVVPGTTNEPRDADRGA
jgi:hypothetical protein